MAGVINLQDFKDRVWGYYHDFARHDLPWRQTDKHGHFDPYHVLVSEVMLQQTQVNRVIPKYQDFLRAFPAIADLAAASQGDILRAWSGLGYNRRAKFLHQAAQEIVNRGNSNFPTDVAGLRQLPGIGEATAGAILAYAFNKPVAFIETNIRTVYIHHFFNDERAIPDSAVLEKVSETLDTEHPREWYWALMDYGTHLKQTAGNASRQSKHHVTQSKFEGSRRQIRGQVIRALGDGPKSSRQLAAYVMDKRLKNVVEELLQEGLIRRANGRLSL